jgi:anhydro-N-acetylmuramic acid kinase
MPLITAIGVISGTSMDGIDVSVVATDGESEVRPSAGRTYPYEYALRAELQAFLTNPSVAETDPLADLETRVTLAHADAVARFMTKVGLDKTQVDVVGMHGQTIWHRPAVHFTRQLCLGALAAESLGIDVVTRFRHADVAAGGQGAPLVPLYHQALATKLDQPLMILNLGGVGNVTYIDGNMVVAFDTGPASALIDDWMLRRRSVGFDADGAFAATGNVDQSILATLLDDPYFSAPAPKSLDRQHFHDRAKIVAALGDADGAATLTAFTIEATAAATKHAPRLPKRWLVTGGGRLNHAIMAGLAQRLGVPVDPVEAVGWNGDFLEAQCFGYLAVRSLKSLPLSLPTTTGVPRPLTGGELFKAPRA